MHLALNCTPPTGTNLTVVKNTGLGFIQGTFGNLAQGQKVNLTYAGIIYPFVANYFGGTGNDLVLQWANTRLLAWGGNSNGQLGTGSSSGNLVPEAVSTSGVLSGKTILAAAAGTAHSLALCADGTVAAWGSNSYGQLGDAGTTQSTVPVVVNTSGVLSGRTVIAVASNNYHSLALCSDGTLAAWGSNGYGQLGNNSTTNSNVPVLVIQGGVLAGKTVVAVEAGNYHSLALCADGSLAAWGYNSSGQLGNGSTGNSSTPVLVSKTGVLLGKTVTAISAGGEFSLALCSDGTVAAWGNNSSGQLGNKNTTSSSLPVAVNTAGVLAGKTVVGISAGGIHSTALGADGAVVAWGGNSYGQLGNNGTTNSTVPVLADRTGVLSGKTVTAVSAGTSSSYALCTDGTMAAWGYNYGLLGNNDTANSSMPVLVNTSALRTGERMVAGISGSSATHALALVASLPPPMATTLAASGILDTGVTLKGSVNANGTSTAVSFEYGQTASYGTTIPATPASVSGTTAMAVSATLVGLPCGTTYHYRVVAASAGGTVPGADMTFTTTNFTSLTSLVLSDGTLAPLFSGINTSYIATVPYTTSSITVTPVLELASSTAKVNGVAVTSGVASSPINLAVGNTIVNIAVSAADGINTKAYTVTVTRLPQTFTFSAATNVPVTVSDLIATGNAPPFALNYTPTVGTNLMVVKNTGVNAIQGSFENLAHGQTVTLGYGGISYAFVANYYGGTGNDLVLQWANTRLLGWGRNGYGELGNGDTAGSLVPGAVSTSGVLAGKTILASAASKGSYHNLALCSDGTLAAWGDNGDGQLGDNSYTDRMLPVAVDQSGVLAGKTVIMIAAGGSHSLALCADGTLAAWGDNYYSQLGSNSTAGWSRVPVLVDRSGVLAGKRVIAIIAGGAYSMALCADGTLAAWGSNSNGELGNNSSTNSRVPVLVNRSGVLAGKTITTVAAGTWHILALCSDGTLAAWGSNSYGKLGNNTTTLSKMPVAVDRSGVLAGKTITAVTAGNNHSLALCSDGSMATWGGNSYGQLGNNGTTDSSVPVWVDRTGVLAGKTVTAVGSGSNHNLALCSDGTLAAWGNNGSGSLGNNSSTNSSVPVLVNTGTLRTSERFVAGLSGCGTGHTICLAASWPMALATTLAATGINDTGATLNTSVIANGATTTVTFEYGLTSAYGKSAATSPATVSGTTATATSASLSGLLSGTTYHYRVSATNSGGTSVGADMTFTTSDFATLSGLSPGSGVLDPVFAPVTTRYAVTVPFATTSITLTPVVAYTGATVKVNGSTVASGSASAALNLTVGGNALTVVVTAAGGVITQTYNLVVTRLPQTFRFTSATTVPVTVTSLVATGITANFELAYAPVVGTVLTVVKNTGMSPITGTFDNLAQGQAVTLSYNGVSYPFVANYYGGTGNDLVLQWAMTRLLAWGYYYYGQLGNNSTSDSSVPVLVNTTGVLAGKTVIATSAGYDNNFALCSDGTLAAWGYNYYGELGNNSTTFGYVPVLVDRTGVLAGKTVVVLSVGSSHSLALCTDGTLAAWGNNSSGPLGNNSTSNSKVPVLVNQSGVLAGKTIIAISAGGGATVSRYVRMAPWPLGVPIAMASLAITARRTAVCRWWSIHMACLPTRPWSPFPLVAITVSRCVRMAPWPHGVAIPTASWATTVQPIAVCRFL